MRYGGADRYETVSAAPEGGLALLHARRAGSFHTLCGAEVDPSWYAWAITRFVHANGNGCRLCRPAWVGRKEEH